MKHGLRSKRGYTRELQESYERALADPDLLRLPKKIALLQAIVDRQVACLDDGRTRDVDALANRVEQLSRVIERHHNIIHKESNIATYDKVRVWLTQAAVVMKMVLQKWVPEDQYEKALAELRDKMSMFGVEAEG